MNDELNSEMRRFSEEVRETLGYPQGDRVPRRTRTSLNFKAWGTALMLGAAGILLVALLIALFAGKEGGVSPDDLAALRDRQDILEEKLIRLEREAVTGADFAKREAELEGSLGEIERSVEFLAIRVEKLAGRVDRENKEAASSPAETESLLPIQRKPLSYGKNTYHMVRPGDTLYKIARLYGTSVEELCRLNNISTSQVIHPGERLLVAPAAAQEAGD
jgi:LysM repeat protein